MDAGKYSTIEAAAARMKLDQAAYQTQSGMLGSQTAMTQACRTPLRDRIYRQMEESNMQARKLERLSELAGLLEKNPDIARILDLIEDVRG